MIEQVVRLLYPPTLLKQPIMHEMMRRYTDLTINIIQARVTPSEGWMEVQLVGLASLIEDAIDWLREKGVDVQTLSA